MLRGILRVSRRDHTRNEEIRRILHLSSIGEVLRGGRLRWFGHVQRRDANNVTRTVMELAIPATRRRGRPKNTWHLQMKEYMTGVGVTQDVALDRKEWRRRTRPTPIGDGEKAIKVTIYAIPIKPNVRMVSDCFP